MSEMIERLRREFCDEDYRYAYDEEFSNAQMATQIKVIREQRKLKQAELAELAEMKQSRISALEDVNYSAWSISTLRRLARALGVRLAFKFESWGELLPEATAFGRESIQRPKFENDPAFQQSATKPKTAIREEAPKPKQAHRPEQPGATFASTPPLLTGLVGGGQQSGSGLKKRTHLRLVTNTTGTQSPASTAATTPILERKQEQDQRSNFSAKGSNAYVITGT